MRYADVETYCMAMPGVTRDTPFDGKSPVFKVGGKMFAMISMNENDKPQGIWFKAGETSYRILTQQDGIKPCPYLARAHWVACDGVNVLKAKELRAYLSRAHTLVAGRLSKKKRAALGIATTRRGEIFDPLS